MTFAHNSEEVFAEHLDLFGIEWIYEPTSFPLKWGSGSIKMMFTPDFFIPVSYTHLTLPTNREV